MKNKVVKILWSLFWHTARTLVTVFVAVGTLLILWNLSFSTRGCYALEWEILLVPAMSIWTNWSIGYLHKCHKKTMLKVLGEE